MWHLVSDVWGGLVRATGHLGREEWLAVFAIVVVIGSYFLRGFGSRTGY